METKDRIKHVMEDRKMSQTEFAAFLHQSPATLSSIFSGRTRPTLNVLEAIKEKIPDISYEWLIAGVGEMYLSHPDSHEGSAAGSSESPQDLVLDFDAAVSPPQHQSRIQQTNAYQYGPNGMSGVRGSNPEVAREDIKIVEREPRRVTEIRVYYDDQTYETFVPAKK